MNMEPTNVMAPPAPRRLDELQLPPVMMRDILLKTMFRMNLDQVSRSRRSWRMPIGFTQELVDLARQQKLVEAMGTLHANSGGEMAYKLSDAGRARAQDALAQSEYFGAMPVPLNDYRAQTKRQSIRNIKVTREAAARGHGPPDPAERAARPPRPRRQTPAARS
jgi:hypothetical protein